MCCGISMAERGPHPNGAVPYLEGANRNVVRPQVERAAAFEIKASVVPMTGQDAVLDTAAFKRKAHVRATIVEREDAPPIIDNQNRTVAPVDDKHPLCLQVIEGSGKRKSLVRRVHEQISRSLFGADAVDRSLQYKLSLLGHKIAGAVCRNLRLSG
jgi:hypothetical protein